MEFLSLGKNDSVGNIPLKFLPSQIPGLKLWNRFNSGITETGLGVSQWNDASGLGNHLKQGTDLDRPQKQADGSILTDGIRQFLKADAFTWNQPEEIFILCKQVTWTSLDRFFDGNVVNTGTLQQITGTPQLRIFAGTAVGNISLALDTYGVISIAINGASSLIQLNNNAPVTGNAGASNMSGFTLGASGLPSAFGNIQTKEVVGYGATLSASQRAQIIKHLATVGGLSI